MFDGGGDGGLSMAPLEIRQFAPLYDPLKRTPEFDTYDLAKTCIDHLLNPEFDYEIIEQNGKFHIWYAVKLSKNKHVL